MYRLFACCLLLAGASVSLADPIGRVKTDSLESIKKDVFFLAGEECEGRGLKTVGIQKAADYIAASFKASGLKSAFADGSYFQPFSIKETSLDAGGHKLNLAGPGGKALEGMFNRDFTVCGLSGPGKVKGEVVFAGYGIRVDGKYDDYANLDVNNKVVIILRRAPGAKGLLTQAEIDQHSPLVAKINLATKLGATGVIFANNMEQAGKDDPLMGFDYARDDSKPSPVPVVHASRKFIDQLLQATIEKPLGILEKEIDDTKSPRSFTFKGWTADLAASISVKELPMKNVVGVLEGAGPLKDEIVVIGAHYDHLGHGERGTKVFGSTDIHYGADDNASGTSGLLELARRLGSQKERVGRKIVFVAFTGEERGLFGSMHFCEKPPFPTKDMVAMFNMDMIGRVRPDEKTKKDTLLVGGVGSAKSFEKLLDDTNTKYDFQIQKSMSGTGPSDHTSFYLAKVPVYFFFSGDHPEYHTPKDRPETINVVGINKVVDMVNEMVNVVSTGPVRPEYVAGVGGSMSGGAGGGPKLGVMPRYDDAETRGMEIGGIVPGGAAEAAGFKKGDRITSIAGKPVKNVQDYMKAMAGVKRGEEVEIKLERDGKELNLKASPK
jgi:hypothetical protein